MEVPTNTITVTPNLRYDPSLTNLRPHPPALLLPTIFLERPQNSPQRIGFRILNYYSTPLSNLETRKSRATRPHHISGDTGKTSLVYLAQRPQFFRMHWRPVTPGPDLAATSLTDLA